MRSVLRRFRLTVMAAALALLTAMPISAQLVHGSNDDDACSQSAVRHDAAQHGIRAGGAPARSPHCAICHFWISGGRFNGPSLPAAHTPATYLGLVPKAPVVEPQRVAAVRRPARAPPAA